MSSCRHRPYRMSRREPWPSLSPLSVERCQHHRLAGEPGLHRLAAQRRIHVVSGLVDAVDRQQFGFELAAEDPRAIVAGEAGNSATTQRAVDINGTTANHLS